MPNIKSAKKRVLVIEKKRVQNHANLSEMKTAIKKVKQAIDVNDIAKAEELLPQAFSIIDSCVSKGIIHKNKAANQKSALAKKISDVKSGKLEIVIKKDNKTIAAERKKAANEAREAKRATQQQAAAEKKVAKIEAEKERLAKDTKKAAPKKTTTKKVDAVKEEPKAKKTTAKTEKAETKTTEATEKKAAPKKATAKKTETATEEVKEKKPAAKKTTAKKADKE